MTLQIALGLAVVMCVWNIVITIIAFICAREGARNGGKLEVHEALMEEAKTVPIAGREAR